MKKYNLAVGYPLGYDIENTKKYNIEIGNKIIVLNKIEHMLWQEMCDPITENRRIDKHLLEILINKDVVVEADSLQDLLESIAYYKPIRQGIGYINNDMFSIVLGPVYYNPKRDELLIWNKANGYKNIINICTELINEFNITSKNFMKALFILVMGDFIVLR